jgi:hypothetical protein
VAGYPSGGVILQPLLDLVERDDFRSSVQKQSLTVMCRFGAWHGCGGWPSMEGAARPDVRITAGS